MHFVRALDVDVVFLSCMQGRVRLHMTAALTTICIYRLTHLALQPPDKVSVHKFLAA